jgi:hypothetical protein
MCRSVSVRPHAVAGRSPLRTLMDSGRRQLAAQEQEAPAGAKGGRGWGWGFDLRDDTLTLSSSWRLWIQRVGEEKVAAHAIVKLGPSRS